VVIWYVPLFLVCCTKENLATLVGIYSTLILTGQRQATLAKMKRATFPNRPIFENQVTNFRPISSFYYRELIFLTPVTAYFRNIGLPQITLMYVH
jgi:hypothetical protein